MAQGDKDKYTGKQKRKAAHIADGYAAHGVPEAEAEARAWATVNKDDGGGKKSGSGRAGNAPAADRSASAKKAAATRKRNAAAKAGG